MDYTKLNELKSQYGDYEEVFNSGDYDKAADILMKVLDVIELEYEDKRKAGMLDNDLNVRKSEGTDTIWLCTNHIMEYYIYACYFEPQQKILMPELPIAEYYRTYADLCVKLQKYKRAEDAYKKALCWNPVDLDSYLGLAECYKYLNMMSLSRHIDFAVQGQLWQGITEIWAFIIFHHTTQIWQRRATHTVISITTQIMQIQSLII